MKKSSGRNVVLFFGSVRIALCLLWMSHLCASLNCHFEVGRETGSSWLSKCIVGLSRRTCRHVENACPKTVPQCTSQPSRPGLRATSKWRIPSVQERIMEERGRRPVSPLGLMWISPKLFLNQLYAWINRKSVPEERRNFSFSVVRREFNSRHYNNLHFFALRQLTRGLDDISNIRLQSAVVRGIRLPFNENL